MEGEGLIGVIVVARYNENTDWANTPPPGWATRIVQKGVDLPNDGREAGSYFWFMATQEIDPSLMYAFVQGDPWPHAFGWDQLRPVDRYTPLGGHILNEDHDGHPNHGGLRLAAHLRDWLGQNPPERFITHAGAMFLVPGSVILSRARGWYEEMRLRVAHGSGPWIMERLWPHVWPPEGLPPLLPSPAAPRAPYEGLNLLQLLHKGDPYAGAHIHPLDLQGWNGELPILERLIREVAPRLVIEVGTWKGQSAATMGRLLREYGGKIVCVDTWLGSLEMIDCPHRSEWLQRRNGLPSVYFTFLSNMIQTGLAGTVIPFPMISRTAAQWFALHEVQAELVYIDASHEYQDVLDDLRHYWPLVRPGGILFGDDYGDPAWPGVRKAVDRFTLKHGLCLEVEAPTWILRKPLEG